MPTNDEIIAAMKGSGFSEVPAGGAAASVLYDVLKASPGQWFSVVEFRAKFEELKLPTKYLSNKLNALKKRTDVECEKSNGTNYYRVSS